jgi:hypothetical protein
MAMNENDGNDGIPGRVRDAAQRMQEAARERERLEAREERERRRERRVTEARIAALGPARNKVRAAFGQWLHRVRLARLPLLEVSRGERVLYSKARLVKFRTELPESQLAIGLWLSDYFKRGELRLHLGADGGEYRLVDLPAVDLTFLQQYFAGAQAWDDLRALFEESAAKAAGRP